MLLSALNQKRFIRFKKNKRGWYSLILFSVLFLFSLCAEFISNEKPIFIQYNNTFYFPVLQRYPETEFGGEFPLEADYKSPYIRQLIAEKNGTMVWPLIPHSYESINFDLRVPTPAPPSADNWLGTDDQGRDVLARLIYGFRISILFALILTIISSAMGVIAGA
ncbi:MAG: ABC transporter permease, partial [Pseudomonas sp.]